MKNTFTLHISSRFQEILESACGFRLDNVQRIQQRIPTFISHIAGSLGNIYGQQALIERFLTFWEQGGELHIYHEDPKAWVEFLPGDVPVKKMTLVCSITVPPEKMKWK